MPAPHFPTVVFAAALVAGASLAGPCPVWAQGAPIGGSYSAHGTNPDGSSYTGTVVIRPDAGRYRFSWLIANGDTFKGTGTRDGDTVVVAWGSKYPVIYQVGADGILHGKWDNGRASETLVPKK
ncbi:MAG: hypothetical protein JNM89_01820 [Hyphomicrobiaceae bacterium]|nr:hypothetical protein [Hyphomicrobiaceae bacterium]